MNKQREVKCVHHFYIDSHDKGTCLKCGAKKQYMSAIDLMEYLDKRPLYGRGLAPDFKPRDTI